MVSKVMKRKSDIQNSIAKDMAIMFELYLEQPKSDDITFLSDLLGFSVHKKKCTYCEKEASNGEGDEIIPVTKGGRMNECNRVKCCASCNQSKGDRTLEQWSKCKGFPLAMKNNNKFANFHFYIKTKFNFMQNRFFSKELLKDITFEIVNNIDEQVKIISMLSILKVFYPEKNHYNTL